MGKKRSNKLYGWLKRKISKAKSLQILSVEHKQRIADANRNRIWSSESKRKISNSLLKRSKESRKSQAEKISGPGNPNFGKPRSEEVKKKISETKKRNRLLNTNNRKIN